MPNCQELFCDRCKKILKLKKKRATVRGTICTFENDFFHFLCQIKRIIGETGRGESGIGDEATYRHFIQWQYQLSEDKWENYHPSINELIESKFGVCFQLYFW